MGRFLARRAGAALITLFVSSIVIFLAVRALPGGPAVALSSESTDKKVIAAITHKYGFDKPLPEQYVIWLGNALRGDFGTSPRTGLPVSTSLANAIPVTLELSILAMLIALVIGIPAGVLAARRPAGIGDYTGSALALAGLSLPHFWFGILLILLFSVTLGVLPAAGFVALGDGVGQNLLHMLMPAVVLGAGLAAVLMRQTRSAMIEALGSDYVRTANAKGMGRATVLVRHALRNSLTSVVTIVGLQLGGLIAGVVTIEQVFSIPGLGKMTLDAVFQRDYSTLQAVVLITALGYVLVNFLVDITYSLINPRVRVSGASA
jgi:peptide/nickel transport system permease protein